MRRIPIRMKLAAALALPLVALVLVTSMEIVDVAGDTREVRDQTELAAVTMGPNSLLSALQDERAFASADLVGVDNFMQLEVEGYDQTRTATDAALVQFRDELDGRVGIARSAYAPALDGLEAKLRQLRGDIDVAIRTTVLDMTNMGTTSRVFKSYTALIVPFFDGTSRVADAVDDRDLRQGGELMATFTRYKETIEELHNAVALPALMAVGPGDEPGVNSRTEIATIAELQDAIREYAPELRSPPGRYAAMAERSFSEEYHRVADEAATQALTTGSIDVAQYVANLSKIPAQEAYGNYRDRLGAAIQDRADELNASATARQRWFVVSAVVPLTVAMVVTWLVSRSITHPLRTLTGQATAMADERLPEVVQGILDTPLGEDLTVPDVEPVTVRAGDEVGDVADALNTVQDAALDLAMEQAVLRRNIADSFVNLGRRNQNLLSRQLDFITELEAGEADADTLGNLFRLDHLATRMRRNAESLLVLAGVEPPRKWAAPVQLTDVIRAALSEVEDYQRVTVQGVEPATIVGSAAADLAHVLAELIENALVFSPPHQGVEIRGRARAADGYTLAVIDSGLGMDPADIETANRRLAGAESFTVAPSKYLGHYVAGNLAARHGISIRLTRSPGNGITAVVDLPQALLTEVGRPSWPAGPADAGAWPVGSPAGPTAVPASAAASASVPGGPARSGRGGVAAGARPGPLLPTVDQLASLVRVTHRDRVAPPLPLPSPARPRGPEPVPGASAVRRPGGPTGASAATGSAADGRGDGHGWEPGPAPGPAGSGPGPRGADAPPPLTPHRGTPPLARRVQGRQLPNTLPLTVPRPDDADDPGPPAGNGNGGHTPGRPAASRSAPATQAAEDLYDLLSSFTAGVERGLEEATRARHQGPPPPG
ncbi:MAG TPA: ATP-binding protein [Acidimicrobiales bacterium]|nr:ATP-binding protein [Acidimicrobiales bacterium]